MGAQTALLAYATRSVADALRNRPPGPGSSDRAEALLQQLHPGWRIDADPEEHATLVESTSPPQDLAYAACFPGVDIVCSGTMVGLPSRLPHRYLDAAEGRTVVLHAMHSVVDALTFALWRDGVLVRSLSLSPNDGVVEDVGERLPFEDPFWAGRHPVEPLPGWPDQRPYPLPFHPLQLGGEALRALFGFTVEGRQKAGDVDAADIPVHRFRLVDPDGPTPEQREAMLKALVTGMKPRVLRMEDGRLVEDGPR
ncbi:DUF6928 family protein [Yinghuangia soli]|uniref:Uncharacterized protein n=1 Tax=Yinghuangia soli TaxID=2908204 RepID=A0AA41Q3E7_9ACTN|nr:hypothetical protein [Yinghuangia soli]MCF2530828.1 hypothetical protein [Yinghuangia soli]